MIIVIGDIILDIYKYGVYTRPNPESNGRIFKVESTAYKGGGAAAVFNHLSPHCQLLAVIGNDNSGRILGNLLTGQNIYIDDNRRTTTKTRLINSYILLDRIDEEDTNDIPNHISDTLLSHRYNVSTLIISDYEKGVVTPYLLDNLPKIRTIIDPGRNTFWSKYPERAIIKANLIEAQHEFGPLHPLEMFCVTKRKQLVITDGANGIYFKDDNTIGHIPAIQVPIVDICGAGDCVLAYLGKSLDEGKTLKESCIIANRMAAECVQRIGA